MLGDHYADPLFMPEVLKRLFPVSKTFNRSFRCVEDLWWVFHRRSLSGLLSLEYLREVFLVRRPSGGLPCWPEGFKSPFARRSLLGRSLDRLSIPGKRGGALDALKLRFWRRFEKETVVGLCAGTAKMCCFFVAPPTHCQQR